MLKPEKYITSNDGTKIGYRQTGTGPGLIIVHGAGRMAQNYQKLATALAGDFTVYTYDRRGRGLSGAITKDHSMLKELDDLNALAAATKADYIFGHSFGGLVALQLLLKPEPKEPNYKIKKVALYDPGVSINGSIPYAWLPEFEKELSHDNTVKAMSLLLKGLQTPGLKNLPAWALNVLVHTIGFLERKKDPAAKMLNLLHTIPADMKMVHQSELAFESYWTINTQSMLLSGTKSQPFFRQSVQALSQVLPDSQTELIEGFDHYSPEEKVQEVSLRLKKFFTA